jgi:hypothetical protein
MRSSAAARAEEIKSLLNGAWLPHLYRDQVMSIRTRSYQLGEFTRNARVEINHTLLGVELQIGRRRLLCPDLATARYLSVFARAGCKDVAIPYDITKISCLADELESSWQRMLLLIDHDLTQSDALRTRTRRLLIAKLSGEIAAAGAGPSVPEFRQSTKQRRTT